MASKAKWKTILSSGVSDIVAIVNTDPCQDSSEIVDAPNNYHFSLLGIFTLIIFDLKWDQQISLSKKAEDHEAGWHAICY